MPSDPLIARRLDYLRGTEPDVDYPEPPVFATGGTISGAVLNRSGWRYDPASGRVTHDIRYADRITPSMTVEDRRRADAHLIRWLRDFDRGTTEPTDDATPAQLDAVTRAVLEALSRLMAANVPQPYRIVVPRSWLPSGASEGIGEYVLFPANIGAELVVTLNGDAAYVEGRNGAVTITMPDHPNIRPGVR